jgi:hypothetical protein
MLTVLHKKLKLIHFVSISNKINMLLQYEGILSNDFI